MKKKKVLFILSSNSYSGAENVIITIMKNMSSTFDMAYSSPYGSIYNQIVQNHIKYIPMKNMSVREVKRVINEYNPDIIHANDFKASFFSALVKNEKKLVSHIHNNAPWLTKKGLKSIIFFYTIKKSNKVLIVSESIKKEFIYSDKVSDKFINIGNPVCREKILKCVGDYEKKYDICCVARVSTPKNPIKFLEVIKEVKKDIKNIKVIWVGGFDPNIKKKVLDKVIEFKLVDNVEFVGYKDNPFSYMAQSKVFLLTSDWEGYGLVVFEALTLGLPCVTSNVGGLTDIVNNECGKLCNNKNIKDYSNEIISLLKEEKYYKIKSQNAVVRSKKLENINRYCKKISNIYNNL